MNEIEDPAGVASRELAMMMRTIIAAGTELAIQRAKAQLDAQREAERALREHRKELLRGAPTQHQQRQWQNQLGSGDAVALKMWDEVYTGTVVTNPNREGEVSVRFDDPRVEAAYGDVWNKAELHVRKPGTPERKAEADIQPEREPSAFEQELQDNLGRGDLVETKDRGNIGTVTTDPDDTGQVAVYFCNKDRDTHFERYFETDDLRVVTSGDPELKGSDLSFSVEGPKGRQIEVADGPALSQTAKPVISKPAPRPQIEFVTDDHRREWQGDIGRGATIKTRVGGVHGTVTTNPDAGSVHVFLDEETNGVQESAFRVEDLEVVSPGNSDLRTSQESFRVETSDGFVEMSAPEPGSAEPPKVRQQHESAEIVDLGVDQQQQKADWQKNIGRGDTVKALDRGNYGTVTTNPNDKGEVSVHFVNKDKGTEYQRGFKIGELEVTQPGPTEMKSTDKPFIVEGKDNVARTVTTGPVIPDVTKPAKEPVHVAAPATETKIPEAQREQAAAKIAALKSQVSAVAGHKVPTANNQQNIPVPRHETNLER